MSGRIFASILAIAIAVGAVPLRAAPAPGESSAFVRVLGNEATRVLSTKATTLSEREAKFQSILYSNFDVRAIGRFALGRYWRQASTEQKNDYIDLFGKYVVQNYASKLGGFSGESLKILSETPLKNKRDVLVNTRIERPSGPPIKITWRVRSRDKTRRIIDVMVEGISMAITQRDQFSAVIRQHGLPGLLETLRARTTMVSAKQVTRAGATKP